MLTTREKKLLREQPPEIIEALLEGYRKEVKELKAIVREADLRKLKESQRSLNIEEQVKLLRKDKFGRSKEDRIEASDRPRDKSQEDAMLFSQAAFPSPELSNTNPQKSKLKETEVIHVLNSEDLLEESKLRELNSPSSDQWVELENVFEKSVKIQILERSYIKEIHKRCKYKLKEEFNEANKDVIITAKGTDNLLSGMNYSTDIVSSVATDKYLYHLPLERQTRKMQSLGLKKMKTSTLSRFCALAASSLEPLQEKILIELKSSDLALHLDETPWKIQRKEQKNGYMWVISNRFGSYYFYKPTRSGEMIRERLEGYHGPVVSDGFSGYNILDKKEDDFDLEVVQAYCWAHARRNFIKLEEHDPSVKPLLDDIDLLFQIDREAKDFDELKEFRKLNSKLTAGSIFYGLHKLLESSRPGSAKKKACEYLLKRWKGFTAFLDDTRIPLSNNEAERTIRHAVVGRKSFYGSGTHNGADTAATLYTVIESCKKNEIDPESFIKMSLRNVAAGEDLESPLEYAKRTRQ